MCKHHQRTIFNNLHTTFNSHIQKLSVFCTRIKDNPFGFNFIQNIVIIPGLVFRANIHGYCMHIIQLWKSCFDFNIFYTVLS